MPLTSTCRNCGLDKSPNFYAENYCETCTDIYNKARTKAFEKNLNPANAGREALAQLAHDAHRNRVNPRFPMTKSDYWASGAPKDGQ